MAHSENVASNSLYADDLSETPRLGTYTDENYFNSTNEENRTGQEINFLTNTIHLNENNTLQYPSSEYLTINQFKSLKNINDNFSIMHLNIRSLNRNSDNLKLLLDKPHQSSFSVIGLTKTWLKKSSAIHYSLPGYNLIENSRNNRTGGGVAFYIKENLD